MTTSSNRRKRARLALPIALVSATWAANIGGTPATSQADGPTSESSSTGYPSTVVPPVAPTAPATVSDADDSDLAASSGTQVAVVPTTALDIPTLALSAYQRAETVINAADTACHLPWQLVAAIGRVESDHGRTGGSALDADGVATPAIVGVPLNGRAGTSVIRDTDAGQLDGDVAYDRAVGPMQFIPGTWGVVGVDADHDGKRDPQDIDDAALAAAVYLCSGSDDLATSVGQQAAIGRYNHSASYVGQVVSVLDGYLDSALTTPDATVQPIQAGELPETTPTTPVPVDPGPPTTEEYARVVDELKETLAAPVAQAALAFTDDESTTPDEPTEDPTDGTDPPPPPTEEPTGSPTPTPSPTPSPSASASASPSAPAEPTTPAEPATPVEPEPEVVAWPADPADPSTTWEPALATTDGPLTADDAAAQCLEEGFVDDATVTDTATDPSDYCVAYYTGTLDDDETPAPVESAPGRPVAVRP